MVKDKKSVTASNQEANVVADILKWTHMPKTHNDLYSQVIDFDNLWQAYLLARRGKRYRKEVADYSANLETNLLNIHNHLVWGSWRPGKSREFRIYEPKQRDIQAPPFADRIVHHALVRVVEPLFEKRFIYHSYACRPGKGTHRAIRVLQQMMRKAQGEYLSPYVIKADIKSYFASIDHEILFSAIRRVISCPATLSLWRRISSAYGHDDGIGLPVGALTSQLSANIMLDQIDHAVTDRMSIRYYVRYMDDIIMISPDKASAWSMLCALRDEVARLGLHLNPKTSVFPARRGVDFCGYRTWPTHILPRKRNIRTARRRLRLVAKRYMKGQASLSEAVAAVSSMLAYAKHCNARKTAMYILSDFCLRKGVNHAD
jgi:retron-type reverse transcriptase